MNNMKNLLTTTLLLCSFTIANSQNFEIDRFETDLGELAIHFIGHGSLMMEWDNKVIHIDPSTREANYSNLPDADLVLITHHHGDHCDPAALEQIVTDETEIILTKLAREKTRRGTTLPNDQSIEIENFKITAIPAYNLVHKRDNGDFFHPKGCCNSYLIEAGGMRIFIGGDTENTPEMKALKDVDIAFLPMNLPYTMTPEMVADAARGFQPRILYPYHYGATDPQELVKLLNDLKTVDVRIRNMP